MNNNNKLLLLYILGRDSLNVFFNSVLILKDFRKYNFKVVNFTIYKIMIEIKNEDINVSFNLKFKKNTN